MLDWLGNRADSLWYWVIAVVFLMLAAWETVRPARPDSGTLLWRWSSNFGIYAVNASILGLLAPAAIIEAYLEARGFPRLFAGLGSICGDWVVLLAGIVVLDLYAYLLHRLQHASFLLWRLHAVHHADADMDASTTVRHHPGEFVLSSIIGATVTALIGLPVWVFPVYALIAISISLIQHANVRLPERLDRLAQTVLVTPGMHRVHHSVDAAEYNGNYGTVLSIWDRMFGTYRQRPHGQDVVAFGVDPFTAPRYARPHWALLLPFALSQTTIQPAADSHAD
jgi:sterol desaturase/sphingolipid hydroxylase (fatty acid hydroxylase superfamily)